MNNETIVLCTEDKELMRDVKSSLLDKGFLDWRSEERDSDNCVTVWEDNAVATYPLHWVVGEYTYHQLSRTDLLTMFLLG